MPRSAAKKPDDVALLRRANAQIWSRYREVCDANVGWAERARLASLANSNLEAEVRRLTSEIGRLRPTLTKVEAEKILAENEKCHHCGRYHATAPSCNRTKSIIMDANGAVLRVVYWPTGAWQPEGLHPDELGMAIALDTKEADVTPA
jgi:putative heme degradation protein